MTKIGIIRCQELAIGPGQRRCAGWNCFPAIRNKTKYMDEYDTIELVGFDTCGGCPGRNRFDKIVERGQKLKEKTHTSPRGDFKPGQIGEYGVVGGGAAAPAAAKKPRAQAHRGRKTAAK